MSSFRDLKNRRFRVTVKFPHDTPALVGEMYYRDDRYGEYIIEWDEGQQYNRIDLENWFDKVHDVFVYIEDEPDPQLGGTAMVMHDREVMVLEEKRLTLGREPQDQMERRQHEMERRQREMGRWEPPSPPLSPSGRAWLALDEANKCLANIKWGDPEHIEWSIDAALGYIEDVAANDIDVLSRATTDCAILWNSRPLERARFQRIVDEEFAKRA